MAAIDAGMPESGGAPLATVSAGSSPSRPSPGFIRVGSADGPTARRHQPAVVPAPRLLRAPGSCRAPGMRKWMNARYRHKRTAEVE